MQSQKIVPFLVCCVVGVGGCRTAQRPPAIAKTFGATPVFASNTDSMPDRNGDQVDGSVQQVKFQQAASVDDDSRSSGGDRDPWGNC